MATQKGDKVRKTLATRSARILATSPVLIEVFAQKLKKMAMVGLLHFLQAMRE